MSNKSIYNSFNNTQNKYDGIRRDILDLIAQDLSPLSSQYGYSDYNLQDFVQWKPLVLVIGNYSAGKSTFINELLGIEVQRTGQAPTDDNFTVLTYLGDDKQKNQDSQPKNGGDQNQHQDQDRDLYNYDSGDDLKDPEVIELDGRTLLGDPSLPFKRLKSQGERFLSHFSVKQVKSSVLRNIAIIDTPGMLDSVSENDRGYKYHEVLNELATLSDLVLLLFDAHKAGTVRESYISLRDTLPKSVREDRVLFVLNRVDECQNIDDLIKVYGSLCWNLSQMTGRKDIPRIYLTYSDLIGYKKLNSNKNFNNTNSSSKNDVNIKNHQDMALNDYLKKIKHQKDEIVKQIINVPKKRMDHLATYVETHTHRMQLLVGVLHDYSIWKKKSNISSIKKSLIISLVFTIFCSLSLIVFLIDLLPLIVICGFFAFFIGFAASFYILKSRTKASNKYFVNNINKFITLGSQYEKDHMHLVEPIVKDLIISKNKMIPSLRHIKSDKRYLKRIEKHIAEIRKKLNKLRLYSKKIHKLESTRVFKMDSNNYYNLGNDGKNKDKEAQD